MQSDPAADLEALGLQFRLSGRWLVVDRCPICRPERDLHTLHIDAQTGAGKCHRASCGWTGGTTLLRQALGQLVTPPLPPLAPKVVALASPHAWQSAHAALTGDPVALERYCHARALDRPTVELCRIGMRRDPQGVCTVIPYFTRDGKYAYAKLKRRDGTDPRKKMVWREPRNAESIVWGLDRLDGAQHVVVTEGEEDAAVLTRAGVANVVSVPDGAAISGPDARGRQRWIDALEPFAEITICFDGDPAGQKGAEALAQILGRERTRIVAVPEGIACADGRTPAKDATDFARAGKLGLLLHAIANAPALEHPLVQHIAGPEAEAEIWAQFDDRDPHGISTGWPAVDRLIGGIRPAEVTVVTGHTGCGKSAFAVNLAVQVAQSGRAVLVASLELSRTDLVWRFLQRIVGKRPWARDHNDGRWAMTRADVAHGMDVLRSLPLHVVHRFGTIRAEEFTGCIRYATRRYGAVLHILDHLHFSTLGAGDRERHVLADTMYALKIAARDHKTSVVAIAHPSRHARGKDSPDLTDLHGSAAIEQIADNVLTIARLRREGGASDDSEIALKKLRCGRSGRLGKAELAFDPHGERFVDQGGVREITPPSWQEEETDENDVFAI